VRRAQRRARLKPAMAATLKATLAELDAALFGLLANAVEPSDGSDPFHIAEAANAARRIRILLNASGALP